jgi:hypothetical protein
MLNVANNPSMLSAVMLNIIVLSVVAPLNEEVKCTEISTSVSIPWFPPCCDQDRKTSAAFIKLACFTLNNIFTQV